MNEGYVYAGTLEVEELERIIKELFSEEGAFYIKEEIDDYQIYEGLPEHGEIPKKGRIFSDKGEVRWEERNDGKLGVLILAEEALETLPIGIAEVNGDWAVERNKIYLVPPGMGHISPKFDDYPKGARRMAVCFYKEKGKNVFISPRRFEK